MPLMGSLYVGTSGVQTRQNSLNTTAQNLSNMGTTGFVRQQVLHGDRLYNKIKNGSLHTSSQQVGLGVTYAKVRQVRDFFLDQSYRRENGRSAFYATSFEALSEVEDLLDEMNDDASFNQSLVNLWKSIEELAKTPDDTVVQRLLVQNANSFLTNAKQVYQGLADYQTEINAHIKENVDRINELGHKISDLNDKIRSIEVGGIESANDFKDARNQCLDELSSMVNISYSEDIFGSVRVKVEGVDFVTSDAVYEMGMDVDASTGFYTPFWRINAQVKYNEDGVEYLDISNAKVFDTTALISSDRYTDIGKLRAMLYIRGDKFADYTDLPVKPPVPDVTDAVKYPGGASNPQYIADVEEYNRQMDKYDKNVDYYNHTVAQSVCMNIEAEFDQLIHNVTTAINGVLYEAFVKSGGTYMTDDNGAPLELFQRVQCDGYKFNGGTWEPVKEITDDDYYSDTLYSIPNLQINPVLIREAGKLKFRLKDGNVDYETAAKLVEAFDADIYSLNPNVTTTCSINTYYTNLVSQVANSGAVYKNISLSQQATVDSINYSREQVQGVSSDEELTQMIKFQNAFNAASRYINVVDDMLEHILTALG